MSKTKCDIYENIHKLIKKISPEYIFIVVCLDDIILKSVFEDQENQLCNKKYFSLFDKKIGYNNNCHFYIIIFKKENLINNNKCILL
jgi:hypothetical protein